jgi:hypothetical protein
MMAFAVLAVVPGALVAQTAQPLAAPVQISAAVSALPTQFRTDATVFGYEAGKKGLVTLREGKNSFICLADDPADTRWHVACYHKSLEPFMLRGRELRAQGITNVDSARFAEIESGKLKMATGPASLYSLTAANAKPGPDGTAPSPQPLFVIYVPFATAESTGLATQPSGERTSPWLMGAGTAKAHIMFVPRM